MSDLRLREIEYKQCTDSIPRPAKAGLPRRPGLAGRLLGLKIRQPPHGVVVCTVCCDLNPKEVEKYFGYDENQRTKRVPLAQLALSAKARCSSCELLYKGIKRFGPYSGTTSFSLEFRPTLVVKLSEGELRKLEFYSREGTQPECSAV